MTSPVQPRGVARDVVGRVEAQASEHVRGDLAALLRNVGAERMHVPQFRREPAESAELPVHVPAAQAVSVGAFAASGYG